MYQEQQEYRLKHAVNASGSAPASVDRVHSIIEDVIRDRRLGEVQHVSSAWQYFVMYIVYDVSLAFCMLTCQRMCSACGGIVSL